jgi:hypothetical protein
LNTRTVSEISRFKRATLDVFLSTLYSLSFTGVAATFKPSFSLDYNSLFITGLNTPAVGAHTFDVLLGVTQMKLLELIVVKLVTPVDRIDDVRDVLVLTLVLTTASIDDADTEVESA